MNVFKFEFNAYKKTTAIWSISLALLSVFMLSIFPAYSKNAQEIDLIIENMPEAFKIAFGLSIGSLTTFLSFMTFIFSYIVMTGAIQAMNLGISIVSKEFSAKTADFLLTKPIPRHVTLSSKILAATALLIITNVIVVSVVFIVANMVAAHAYDARVLLMICSGLLFVQLIFMALGILIAVITPKIKNVLSVSMGVVFGFFVIGMVGSLFDDHLVRYLCPFFYVDSKYIIEHSTYDWSYMFCGGLVIVISLLLSYRLYVKRDIHTV